MTAKKRTPSEDSTHQRRVLLVDDHPIVRQGLAKLIEQEHDLTVCGEAEDTAGAMRLIEQLTPDLAIIDLTLKDASGLELVKQVKAQHEELPILVLSMHDESLYAPRALRAGAKGYIMKQEAPESVVTAIRRILGGDVYLSERMTSQMLSHAASGKPMTAVSPIDKLSDRELEVFELIGHGLSTREIAERIHRSVKTIESHREHIKEKLDLANATALTQRAVQWVESASRA